MWSQKYLVIDELFFEKFSRMYLCTLPFRKWWMDEANTEQMVGGIRLRIKISQWMCALILHDFVQFFTLQFGQCYVSSHLFYTRICEHQCQHQNRPALLCVKLLYIYFYNNIYKWQKITSKKANLRKQNNTISKT